MGNALSFVDQELATIGWSSESFVLEEDGAYLKKADLHDPETVQLVMQKLKSKDDLKKLEINRCRLNSNGMKFLAPALPHFTMLQVLSLGSFGDDNITTFNVIGDQGAIVLSEHLVECVELRAIRLQRNRIGVSGATAIAKSLNDHANLMVFDISHNPIQSEGFDALCTYLPTTLKKLGVSFCEIAVPPSSFLRLSKLEECRGVGNAWIQGGGGGAEFLWSSPTASIQERREYLMDKFPDDVSRWAVIAAITPKAGLHLTDLSLCDE